MTQTERMKLAIQQKKDAAKMEAVPPSEPHKPKINNVDAQTDGAGDMLETWEAEQKKAKPKEQPPAAKQPKPPKAKKPKPNGFDRQPEKFDTASQLHDRSRLPAGARFNVEWNGERWDGELIMADGHAFALAGRKLFRLLADIDKLYREWKAKIAEVKS